MRKHWMLPPESAFMDTGREWFLNLLDHEKAETRAKVIFLLWRVWHHRNDVVHADGKASISASVPYLCNYYDTFSSIKSPLDPKGKLPILPVHVNKSEGFTTSKWAAPEEANLKVNVDAGWDVATKQAGLGLIIRDHRGRVILTEWKFLPGCISAEEAEALACLDGIKQAIKLQCINVTVESDCARVVQIMSSVNYDRSPSWCVHLEGRELLKIYRHIKMEGSARYCPEYTDIDMTVDLNGTYSPASVPRGSNASRFTVDLNNELSEWPDLRRTLGSNTRHMINITGPPPP
ncbi:hypothetical protein QYE76_062623 [Lolium multiflorum]|uniref:RNase H type-1 domain-containing protein n=1 Tax=Lolium multiflorum TaxID=4521 RepID=A0AAD8S4U5_LOLMU|nr:hypothetical protein QYE76_062623 [Lolium multiflorum]